MPLSTRLPLLPALVCAIALSLSLACGGHGSRGGGTGSGGSGGGTGSGGGGALPDDSGIWVQGYYVSYLQQMQPHDQIDFRSITHLMVSGFVPGPSGEVTFDFGLTGADAKDLADRAHAAHRKAIAMIGGAGTTNWASAASDAHRAGFVQNLVLTAHNLGYDGVDLDWEDGFNASLMVKLVNDLRTAAPSLILTAPVGWVNANFPGVDPIWAQLQGKLDRINIMSYGMADNWDGWKSWHSSALLGESGSMPSSIDSSVKAYLAAGVPAQKLGLGIGFYGSCWKGATAPRQTIATGGGVVADDNAISYTNIMATFFDPAARSWDDVAQVPYLSFPSGKGSQGCQFISYDDPQSVAAKGAYLKAHQLGGAIIWTINEGHIASAAPGTDAADPLLAALRGQLQ